MSAEGSILLIAPEGMLGRAWVELFESRGIAYQTASLPEFDITDPNAIAKFVTPEVGAAINCCAYTNVDGAEESEDMATLVNGTGVGYLAEACAQADVLLVHYSTDYVFNGRADKPYRIDAPIEPCNAYGRSKAEGERQIRFSGAGHLIVRTSWLYAPWANNFVLTIAKLAREREALQVVNDQRGRPTSAQHLAETTLRLMDEHARGTLHVTDGGECTWFDFAAAIAANANPDCKVEPCGSDQYPRPAVRPAYSVLDIHDTEAIVGRMTPWQDNLAAVLEQLSQTASDAT